MTAPSQSPVPDALGAAGDGIPLHDLLAVACCDGCPHPMDCGDHGCLRDRPIRPSFGGGRLSIVLDENGQPLGGAPAPGGPAL